MTVPVSKKQNSPNPKKEQSNPICGCGQDPYADLPPGLQPKKKSWKSGFRHVTCPGCGLEYWTNCEGYLCTDCQKKGIQIPKTETPK